MANLVRGFQSSFKGGKRSGSRLFEYERTSEKTRSLSRNNVAKTGRMKAEDTKTLASTPRSSLVDNLPGSRSILFNPKVKKNITSKKTKKLAEEPQASKKKQKQKKNNKEQFKKDAKNASLEKITISKMTSQTIIKKPQTTCNRKKQEKKDIGFATSTVKESPGYNKHLLNKKLTLDDENGYLNPTSSDPFKMTKTASKTPKEGSTAILKPVKDKLKKCLDDQKMKQVNQVKMKASFKGELASKIKNQAIKLVGNRSKEKCRASSPAVEEIGGVYYNTHRSTNSKKFREIPEDALEKLRTELSVDTDKISVANQSPFRQTTGVISNKGPVRNSSSKLSPTFRPNRLATKPYLTSMKKDKGIDKSVEKRTVGSGQILKSISNKAKWRAIKELAQDPNPRQFKDKAPKLVQTFIYKNQIEESAPLKEEPSRFHSPSIPAYNMASMGNCSSSAVDTHISPLSICCSLQCRFTSNSEPKDLPERVFESKPEVGDRQILNPLPEMNDMVSTRMFMWEVNRPLVLDSSPTDHLVALPDHVNNNFRHCLDKRRHSDCFEDIPNMPQDGIEEAKPSIMSKRRVQPIIAQRSQGIRSIPPHTT